MSVLLTPSAISTTGTGVDLRLETTSLSPLLLALTKYWSKSSGQDYPIFNSLDKQDLILTKLQFLNSNITLFQFKNEKIQPY